MHSRSSSKSELPDICICDVSANKAEFEEIYDCMIQKKTQMISRIRAWDINGT